MEFFRHCPACGKRFHIKLEDKKLVTSHTEKIPRMMNAGMVYRQGSTRGSNPAYTPLTVHEGNPIIVDVEEFQYSYKCGHCGHEWTEEHFDEHRIK